MKYFLFLLSAITILSCSDAKRMQRILKRHPEWVTTDTIYRSDTTIISATHTDTEVVSHNNHDTITLTKNNLTVKVIKSFDTLRISGDIKADTIVKTIPITITKISPPKPIAWWECFLGYVGAISIIILAAILALKFMKSRIPI